MVTNAASQEKVSSKNYQSDSVGSSKNKPAKPGEVNGGKTDLKEVQLSNEAVRDDRIVLIVADFAEVTFDDKEVRLRFIRKVYLLLVAQILLTAAITAIFLYVKPVKEFMQENSWIVLILLVGTFAMFIAITCFETIRRTVPLNFCCLFFCNILIGALLGVIAATYSFVSILLATGITFAVFLALTLFAFQTRWDITMMGGIIFAMSVCLLFLAIFMIFLRDIFPWLQLLYACLMAIVISVYIVFDTQLLLGGRHRYTVSPEEYIYASFNLYIDIVYLFCLVLSCCGTRQ